MSSPSTDRILAAYPRWWVDSHGEARAGMLEESDHEHPELAQTNRRHALRRGYWYRFRWAVPYGLAGGSLVSTTTAIILAATAFTTDNAVTIQALLFAVAPALSLLAITTGASISGTMSRSPWVAMTLVVGGIVAAGAAHVAWYAMVDTEDFAALPTRWVLLVGMAVAFLATAAVLALDRSLAKSLPPLGAGALAVLAGVASAGVLVPFLAIPVVGPVAAVASIVCLILFHRRQTVRRTRSLATVPKENQR
jgi:hypothetical protein